jgi:hypothetical protein
VRWSPEVNRQSTGSSNARVLAELGDDRAGAGRVEHRLAATQPPGRLDQPPLGRRARAEADQREAPPADTDGERADFRRRRHLRPGHRHTLILARGTDRNSAQPFDDPWLEPPEPLPPESCPPES